MSSPAKIADAKTEHLDALEELEKLCFSLPWSREMLKSQINADDGIFLVAETARGDIIGYAGCRTVLDEGYITNVAVSPGFRRRGEADALLKALIGRARKKGLSFLTLEVREGNAPAIALYEKHGFGRVGLRPNYYEKPNEAAVLMTLFLR